MPIEPRNSTWYTYPNQSGRFLGFWTDEDPSYIPDLAAPNGQNTTPNEGDRISIRNYGFDIFPSTATLSTTATPTRSLYTFHKRDGEQILMAAQGANLLWFDEVSQTYANLGNAYTSDDFGFAEMNINTDQTSYIYFGNGVQDFSRWTGSHTNLDGALVGGESTITVLDTTDFAASGTIRIGTTNVTYSGKTATTFTGAVGTPAALDGAPVAEAIQTYGSNPKGNIYLASDNRLFIAGISTAPQAIYFSKYADATNFTSAGIVTAATAEDPGIFNLVEGGGAVTAMVKNEKTNYFFKENIIYAATLSDEFYTLEPLKPYDGRSQTTGARTKRSVFVGANQVFFVSKDNQIYALQRVETLDYPQMVPISEPIQPTVSSLDFSAMSGIVYNKMAYFTCKSSPTAAANDVTLVFNTKKNTWDTPVVNFNASEWAVYAVDDMERLLFGDSINANVYIIQNIPVDYIYDTLASYRTKRYDFGVPEGLKELDNIFVEGYISSNTALTVNLYLDEDGYTQTLSTTLQGTETQYEFAGAQPNTFGIYPFGVKRFGSNDALSNRIKFRIYLAQDLRRKPFFNAQLEFLSNGSNQQWEIIRYGFQVRMHAQPMPTNLIRSWSE